MNRREFTRMSAMAALGLAGRRSFGEDFDYPWKLGIITDEVDFDLARVLSSFYPKYQLHWAEIRDVRFNGHNEYVYKSATPGQLKQIRKQLDDAGVKLSVLDTAVYKVALPGTNPKGENAAELNPEESAYKQQLDDLKKAA